METEGSLPRSQESTTEPYPEPDEFKLLSQAYFLRIHSNFISTIHT
jgi:hypothetical protein